MYSFYFVTFSHFVLCSFLFVFVLGFWFSMVCVCCWYFMFVNRVRPLWKDYCGAHKNGTERTRQETFFECFGLETGRKGRKIQIERESESHNAKDRTTQNAYKIILNIIMKTGKKKY